MLPITNPGLSILAGLLLIITLRPTWIHAVPVPGEEPALPVEEPLSDFLRFVNVDEWISENNGAVPVNSTDPLSSSTISSTSDATQLLVETQYGPLIGRYNRPEFHLVDTDGMRASDSRRFGWGRAFLGIPFARPPVDQRRFEPAEAWSPIWKDRRAALLADEYSGPCWQLFDVVRSTEDCLYLNVYVPPWERMERHRMDGRKLPVMIWFYGGAFIFGDAQSYGMYDGGFVVTNKDIIMVSFNHRLGPLGFLTLSNSTLKGNYAYSDALAAVRWVKENIDAFGGDPEQITVYGLSSGAALLTRMLVDPGAPSIQRAIIMSNPLTLSTKSRESSDVKGDVIASKLDCYKVGEPHETLDCLRKVSAAQLWTVSTIDDTSFQSRSLDRTPMGDALYWGPTMDLNDPDDQVRGKPLNVLANPTPEQVERLRKMDAIMLGTSEDEMAFFTNPVTMNGRLSNFFFYLARGDMSLGEAMRGNVFSRMWDGVRRFFKKSWAWMTGRGGSQVEKDPDQDLETYARSIGFDSATLNNFSNSSNAAKYTHNARLYRNLVAQSFADGDFDHPRVDQILTMYPPKEESYENVNQMKLIMNDYMFQCSARRFLKLVSRHVSKLYRYEFRHVANWGAPVFGSNRSLVRLKGAAHAMEFPFVFNKFPPLQDENDQVLSRWMIDRFTAFASGDVDQSFNPHRLAVMTDQGLQRADLVSATASLVQVPWTPYNVAQDNFMVLQTPNIEMQSGLRTEFCEFWDQLSRSKEEAQPLIPVQGLHPELPYNF